MHNKDKRFSHPNLHEISFIFNQKKTEITNYTHFSQITPVIYIIQMLNTIL